MFFHREYMLPEQALRSKHSSAGNVAGQRIREERDMQTTGTRIEAKKQALSWLVSQLRWEETLEDLRDHRHEQLAQAA